MLEEYKSFINSEGEATIPYGYYTIEESAFSNCIELRSVVIPSSVTSIERFAFNGCKNLVSVELPNSISKIGWYAFSCCEQLTDIEIPEISRGIILEWDTPIG